MNRLEQTWTDLNRLEHRDPGTYTNTRKDNHNTKNHQISECRGNWIFANCMRLEMIDMKLLWSPKPLRYFHSFHGLSIPRCFLLCFVLFYHEGVLCLALFQAKAVLHLESHQLFVFETRSCHMFTLVGLVVLVIGRNRKSLQGKFCPKIRRTNWGLEWV